MLLVMKAGEGMALQIDEEKIRELAHNHQIDSEFPYLDDPEIMYVAIRENYNLVSLLENRIIKRVISIFNSDKTISFEESQTFFDNLIDYYDQIPENYIKYIDSENYYRKLATKSLLSFAKLSNLNHPYKDIEKRLFYELYEDKYIINLDYPIDYAKKSSKVLLNTLKNNILNIYYISFFDKEAISDEVIEYIDEKNLIDNFNIPVMYQTHPKFVLLKLKRNLDFVYSLTDESMTDEILNYLKSINFSIKNIISYIDKYKSYPYCLKSSKLMLLFLEESLDNIKYFNGDKVSDELGEYLVSHHYIYKKGDNLYLLNHYGVYQMFIQEGDISIIFKDDIKLNDQQINDLINKIADDKIPFPNICNKNLLNNKIFVQFLISHYSLNNPFNLNERYLVTSLGCSLEKLRNVFENNDIKIIIREIIENDYFIDMIGILNNIDIKKFKELYDGLSQKENKINKRFDFYYFIKITEYLASHLSLVSELNNQTIDDEIFNNLSLAINNKDDVSYQELVDYNSVLKKRINNSSLTTRDKIYKIMVNGDEDDVKVFLREITDTNRLLYLQLEFSKDTYEYQLLESYLDIIKILEKLDNYEVLSNVLLDEIIENFNMKPLFDLSVMKKNILMLYARIYKKLCITKEDMRKAGKSEIIGEKEIFYVDNYDFVFFVHNEDFNSKEDSTSLDVFESEDKNYICTCYASELFPYKLNVSGMEVYEFSDVSSLISFGNKDIYINHTKKPMFTSTDQFENPIDMAFLHDRNGYVPTEFDFLRFDVNNKKLRHSLIVVSSREEALKDKLSNCVLVFDEQKNQEYLDKKFEALCQNVSTLEYKSLYKLIAMSYKYTFDDDLISSIVLRISEMNEKEQLVLNDALKRYQVKEKNSSKKM